MSRFIGDFVAGATITQPITTYAAAGSPVAPNSAFENADIVIYKGASATQRSSAAGITMTSPFDSTTGLHMLSIDLSDNTDSGFYAAGNDYHVMLVPDETVDSLAVMAHLFTFSIQNRFPYVVPAGGIPSLGIGRNGTLSGTHSSTTADLGAPGSTGAPNHDITGWTLFFPAHELSVLVTAYNTSTGVATFAAVGATLVDGNAWWLFPTAAGPAVLDAAGVRSAVGLSSADLDTQLSGINNKTTNLPSDPADESLIIAATDAIYSRLGAPAGASTAADIAAIKAVLPTALQDGFIKASLQGAKDKTIVSGAGTEADPFVFG